MTHINQRHDFAGAWLSENPVLMAGEVGWETDTRKSKLGDGVTTWNDLPYTAAGIDATKADVGLSEVDNTSDMDKPVSTAQKAYIDSGDAALNAAINAAIASALTQAKLDAHPVGSYYHSDDPTDPHTLFGGTWTRVKGKFLVGLDEADATWDTVGETGGTKTNALTANNLPAHTHALGGSTGNDTPDHTHGQFVTNPLAGGTGIRSDYNSDGAAGAYAQGVNTGGASTRHTHTLPANTGNNTTTGDAVNNLPPFQATYIWRRTA